VHDSLCRSVAHFGRRFDALCQNRCRHATFSIPTDEVDLAHALAQSGEDRGGGCVLEPGMRGTALPSSDEHEQKRARRALGTPAVNGQEVPERGLVVGMSGWPAAIRRICRDCLDCHSVAVISKTFALDELGQMFSVTAAT